MIVKHIDNKPDNPALVFLAQSPRGTLMYDYAAEKFVIVEGFSTAGAYRCVYDKSTVKEMYSLHEAYRTLWPEEVKSNGKQTVRKGL